MEQLPTEQATTAPDQQFDPETEVRLDLWVKAKREKDFATADSIRSELRAKGIEPDLVRPPGFDVVIDAEVEQKLDMWVQAKRDRNFGIADSIRAELRTKGVDPDTVRPPGFDVVIDPAMEVLLDQWVTAKRARDFVQADSIRSELRAKGVDPDTVRPPGYGVVIDEEADKQLDRWVQAKRDKDFGTADEIRSDLRAKGIDPDTVRPPGFDVKIDDMAEQQLDRWVQAKREKDFATADAIRSELRARGIEPDVVRPPGFEAGLGQVQMTAEISRQLDLWVAAKRDKDFATADAIRSDLRSKGIDPDTVRPPARSDPLQQAGALNLLQSGSALYSPVQVARAGALPLPRAVGPVSTGMRGATMALQTTRQMATLGASTNSRQREIDRQLDRWVEAKRAKDFVTADEIRARLRKQGIEPDTVRPAHASASASGVGGFGLGGVGAGAGAGVGVGVAGNLGFAMTMAGGFAAEPMAKRQRLQP